MLDPKDVETFLKVVTTRNITQAAEQMFLSQSVVSSRIKHLEEEMGRKLLIRAKGKRSIDLTKYGENFVSIALEWKNLFEKTESFKREMKNILRVATIESAYGEVLNPFVMEFMKKAPDLRLELKIQDSVDIYSSLAQNRCDFGFVSYQADYPNIEATHIYSKEYVVVRYCESPHRPLQISPQELDPAQEIRLNGGNSAVLDRWREKWFGNANACKAVINSPHFMIQCLREFGGWTLCTGRTARNNPLQVYRLTDPPGKRSIFLLNRVYDRELPLLLQFKSELQRYIAENLIQPYEKKELPRE